MSSHTATAAQIRTRLKAAFPGIRFTVRTHAPWVHVGWVDGPTEQAVREVANWQPRHGGLSVARSYSPDALGAAAALIRTNHQGERFIRHAGVEAWQVNEWDDDDQIARRWLRQASASILAEVAA